MKEEGESEEEEGESEEEEEEDGDVDVEEEEEEDKEAEDSVTRASLEDRRGAISLVRVQRKRTIGDDEDDDEEEDEDDKDNDFISPPPVAFSSREMLRVNGCDTLPSCSPSSFLSLLFSPSQLPAKGTSDGATAVTRIVESSAGLTTRSRDCASGTMKAKEPPTHTVNSGGW